MGRLIRRDKNRVRFTVANLHRLHFISDTMQPYPPPPPSSFPPPLSNSRLLFLFFFFPNDSFRYEDKKYKIFDFVLCHGGNNKIARNRPNSRPFIYKNLWNSNTR